MLIDFAAGRSDDGVFLAENPWENGEIESAIKEENFGKLKEIIEKMDFPSSDDESSQFYQEPEIPRIRNEDYSSESASSLQGKVHFLHEVLKCLDNPTIILMKEDSEKFKSAIEQFSAMFPDISLGNQTQGSFL